MLGGSGDLRMNAPFCFDPLSPWHLLKLDLGKGHSPAAKERHQEQSRLLSELCSARLADVQAALNASARPRTRAAPPRPGRQAPSFASFPGAPIPIHPGKHSSVHLAIPQWGSPFNPYSPSLPWEDSVARCQNAGLRYRFESLTLTRSPGCDVRKRLHFSGP